MKKSLLSFFLFGALLSAAPVNVTFVDAGNPGVVRSNDYVGPYTLSINGVITPAMCMDDFLEVYWGDKWTANVTNAAGPNFKNTYLGNHGETIDGIHISSKDVYSAEAYLFSLLIKPGADRSDIQEAAWAIMDQNTLNSVIGDNDRPVETYLLAAVENYKTFNASGFRIISETGRYNSNFKQEFMVASAPEPASMALLGGGLLLAGGARFLRRRRKTS